MAKKFTEEEYALILDKKLVGTAVLLFNSRGELLIVKPDYREEWLVPGGSTDSDESPLHCAHRETMEEVGLDIPVLQLVGVYYGHKKGVFADSLKFIFSGGVLSDEQIAKIKVQEGELLEWKFLIPEDAIALLSSSLKRSLPKCLEAIENKMVAYIE